MKWLQIPLLIPNKEQEDEIGRLKKLGIPSEEYDKQYFIVDGEINLNNVCVFYAHNQNTTMFEMIHKNVLVNKPLREIQKELEEDELQFKKLLNMDTIKTKGDIEFNEEKHSYNNTKKDTYYKSATTWIKQFSEEFIADESKTKSTQEKLGISHEEVLKLWEDKRNEASIRGTNIHKFIEDLIEYKDHSVSTSDIINSEEKENIISYLDGVSLLKNRRCKWITEDILHNDVLNVAGQSDLVQVYKKHIVIRDWKTNQKTIEELKSSFNNKKMKFPFNYLLDSTFNKYILQLSLYSIFAEEEYGLPVRDIYIVHINKKVVEHKVSRVLFNKVKKTLRGVIYGN